jgi:rhomboid family GlyGly-CTERM serine protease
MCGPRAWVCVAVGFAGCALLGWPLAPASIDWQPALAWRQPWRAFTAIGVHYSAAHLVGNLAGAALVGVFGVAARVPARMAWAWLAAWPLTHLGLLVRPDLAHYGGLSGVVHAGVAIVIVFVLASGTRRQRLVGSAVLVGFCAKLLSEAPWGAALRHPAGWDIAVAPIAHTTGAIAGAIAGTLAGAVRVVLASGRRRRMPSRSAPPSPPEPR